MSRKVKQPLKILPISLGRSITSHDLVDVTENNLKCDIIIVSEHKLNKKEDPWIADKRQLQFIYSTFIYKLPENGIVYLTKTYKRKNEQVEDQMHADLLFR